MTWQTLLLAAFGVYYVSYAISNDEIDGPWNVFKRLRGVWTDPRDWKARGIRCVVCVSCWVALLWTLQLLWMGAILWSDVAVVWLGLAGMSVVIARYWQR
jgi:hypothetical protein